MRIASARSDGECEFSVLDAGKEIAAGNSSGDGLELLFQEFGSDFNVFVAISPTSALYENEQSFQALINHISEVGGEIVEVGHHQALAADVFFSCEDFESIIAVLSPSGFDQHGNELAYTLWYGRGNKIAPLIFFQAPDANINDLPAAITYAMESTSCAQIHVTGNIDDVKLHDDLSVDVPASAVKGAVLYYWHHELNNPR